MILSDVCIVQIAVPWTLGGGGVQNASRVFCILPLHEERFSHAEPVRARLLLPHRSLTNSTAPTRALRPYAPTVRCGQRNAATSSSTVRHTAYIYNGTTSSRQAVHRNVYRYGTLLCVCCTRSSQVLDTLRPKRLFLVSVKLRRHF